VLAGDLGPAAMRVAGEAAVSPPARAEHWSGGMDDDAHLPVLVDEVVAALQPRAGGIYVDATVGLGGHAAALLEREPAARLIGFDVDAAALAVAGLRLLPFGERATLIHASYEEMKERLHALGTVAVDGVLFDLGVSSLQLDTPERGFSFRFDSPLDMRFSGAGTTARDVLADASEEELVRIFRDFGEEPRALRVARSIVRARHQGAITTTGELHRIVRPALGARKGRVDPATRVFQALRIATNRELEGIAPALVGAGRLLRPAGRLAVIAFHSLEDRLVKRTLRHLSGRCICAPGTYPCSCGPEEMLELIERRPIRPSPAEMAANPRSRSARLRVAARRPA
jgi:16S rRNA (cytosine1402-N4)-methyltransferase